MFLTGAKDGQLLCPTAGAVFMLLRSAMSAAAGHTISTLMPSAVVRDIPATANVYVSAPVVDGCRRLVLVKSLPVSHSPDGQPVAVSASLTECAAGRAGHPQSTAVFMRPGPPGSIRRPGNARRGVAPGPGSGCRPSSRRPTPAGPRPRESRSRA